MSYEMEEITTAILCIKPCDTYGKINNPSIRQIYYSTIFPSDKYQGMDNQIPVYKNPCITMEEESNNFIGWYPKYNFVNLQEWRDKLIDEILD